MRPEELVDEVFIPARRGSLQTEMLAATRTRGFVAYVLEPRFDALIEQIAAGRAVVVLLNLGVDGWPRWHYAVVIGYDVAADEVILRSGRDERAVMSKSRFNGAWNRAARWAFMPLPAGVMPASPDAERYARAVADLESAGKYAAAAQAFASGTRRWPNEAVLWLGLGNSELAAGHVHEAEKALATALQIDPDNVAARNNLASLLSARGCRDAALAEIAEALRRGEGSALADDVSATAEEIEARPALPGARCPATPSAL